MDVIRPDSICSAVLANHKCRNESSWKKFTNTVSAFFKGLVCSYEVQPAEVRAYLKEAKDNDSFFNKYVHKNLADRVAEKVEPRIYINETSSQQKPKGSGGGQGGSGNNSGGHFTQPPAKPDNVIKGQVNQSKVKPCSNKAPFARATAKVAPFATQQESVSASKPSSRVDASGQDTTSQAKPEARKLVSVASVDTSNLPIGKTRITPAQTRYPIYLTGNDPKFTLPELLHEDNGLRQSIEQSQDITLLYTGGFTAIKHCLQLKRQYPQKNIKIVVADNSFDCQQAWKALKYCVQKTPSYSDFLRDVGRLAEIDPNNRGRNLGKGAYAGEVSEKTDRSDLTWQSIEGSFLAADHDENNNLKGWIDLSKHYESRNLTEFFGEIIHSNNDLNQLKTILENNFHFTSADWTQTGSFDSIKLWAGRNSAFIVNESNIPSCLGCDTEARTRLEDNLGCLDVRLLAVIESKREGPNSGLFLNSNKIVLQIPHRDASLKPVERVIDPGV